MDFIYAGNVMTSTVGRWKEDVVILA